MLILKKKPSEDEDDDEDENDWLPRRRTTATHDTRRNALKAQKKSTQGCSREVRAAQAW